MPMQMTPDAIHNMIQQNMQHAIQQAVAAQKKLQISCDVEIFSTPEELRAFLKGRKIIQFQLVVQDGKLVLAYGVQR